MNLDRRRFLQVAAIGVVSAIVYPACERAKGSDSFVVRPELLGMLGPERVRQLGARYRSMTPGENAADVLRAKVAGKGARIPFIGHQSIDDRIRDDFAKVQTVLVDGWIL